MPGNTAIHYQGFLCNGLAFRRSNGVRPDSSVVEIFHPDFLAIQFVEDKGVARNVTRTRGAQPFKILKSGSLVISSTINGETHSRTIEDMYVSDVRKPDAYNKAGVFQVTLLDGRVLWDRGWIDEWRYVNVPLKEIVTRIMGRLPWHEGVVRMPPSWDSLVSMEFREMERPRNAIERILKEYNAVLSVSDKKEVSFWNKGEASGQPFTGYVEHDNGNGFIRGKKFTYKPTFVGIAGGPRIATVAIDNWVPVLKVGSEILPITDGILALSRLSRRPGNITPDNKSDQSPNQPEPGSLEDQIATLSDTLSQLEASREQGADARIKEIQDEVLILNARIARLTAGGGDIVGPQRPFVDRIRKQISVLTSELEGITNVDKVIKALKDQLDILQNEDNPDRPELFKQTSKRIIDEAMQFLRRFVLRPDMWQTFPGFSQAALEVFKLDAFRLYQLPGATTYNKSLLPMLKRAERESGGKRLPIKAKVWRWLKKSDSAIIDRQVSDTEARLIGLRGEAVRLFVTMRGATGFFESNFGFFDRRVEIGADITDTQSSKEINLAQKAIGALKGDISDNLRQIASAAIASARGDSVAREIFDELERPDLVAALDRAVRAYDAAQRKADPHYTGDLERQLVKKMAEAAEKLRQLDRSGVIEAEVLAQQLRVKKIAAARARAAGENQPPPESHFFVNATERIEATDVQIVDANLGLVRFSKPVGLLNNADQIELSACDGLSVGSGPHGSWPVKVYFGTRLAPRRGPPPTGNQSDGDEYPPQFEEAIGANDRELGSFSVSIGADFSVKPLGESDAKETFTVFNGKLVELITLDGSTNRSELERKAQSIAEPHLLELGIVKSTERKFLRPIQIDTDGVVSGIQINAREGLQGFNTIVTENKHESPFDAANKDSGAFDLSGAMMPEPYAEDPEAK